MKKGKYIKTFYDDINDRPVHIFEYRGYEYEVIGNVWKGGYPPAYEQHRNEQHSIDKLIERKKTAAQSTYIGEDAEKGFELFWEIINN